MKQKKFITALSMGLSLTLLFSGCSAGPGAVESPGVSPNQGPVEVTPSSELQPIRIALCTSPDSMDDGSRNSACYEGIYSFFSARGEIDSITPLQETSGDPVTALRSFREVAPSYDVMVFVGTTFSGISSIALEYPDIYFILVDAPLTDASGAEISVSNVCSLQFAEQECGFFAGMAAALETQTNRIAVINDLVSPANTRYYYGFRSGVAYANGNFGTQAELVNHPAYSGKDPSGQEVEGNYIGSSYDLSTGYALAQSLIAESCDILFVAAGYSGTGVYTAAMDLGGAKVIGTETDQFSRGEFENGNVVLTSVTKAFSDQIARQLFSIADGSFQGGKSLTLRAADLATGYVSDSGRQQLSPQTLEALAAAYPMMQDGTIVPMSGPAS